MTLTWHYQECKWLIKIKMVIHKFFFNVCFNNLKVLLTWEALILLWWFNFHWCILIWHRVCVARGVGLTVWSVYRVYPENPSHKHHYTSLQCRHCQIETLSVAIFTVWGNRLGQYWHHGSESCFFMQRPCLTWQLKFVTRFNWQISYSL